MKIFFYFALVLTCLVYKYKEVFIRYKNVILLIYEYAIAVEWSLVQNKRAQRRSDNITSDSPIADRLDRSYFGFDQDYYERMPLLVNAMQENSYVDPFIDMPLHKRGRNIETTYHKPTTTTESYRKTIRRTSPRPFIYELRHPTPVPFSKTFGSKSWIESYRNAQRLQNIQQIIKYLEKTINAKVGDLHSPSSTHIAFSGVYVEPMVHNKHTGSKQVEPTIDLLLETSKKTEIIKSNHQPDPLFKYKPETPGDVNMLADNYFRFLPISPPRFIENKEHSNIPMFKPIPTRNFRQNLKYAPSETHTEKTNMGVPKSFSVMLNLFPLLNTLASGSNSIDATKTTSSIPQLDNVYFTTTRPQFRRKSIVPIKHIYYKRARVLNGNKTNKHSVAKGTKDRIHQNESSKASNMIVHINVYAPDKKTEINDTQTTTEVVSNEQQTIINQVTDIPFQLSTSQVEDFHIGSSGVIPVESRFNPPPAIPVVTPMIPFFDITPSPSTTSPTNPPEIVKFSHEDAKVPDQYKTLMTPIEFYDRIDNIEITRRNSRNNIDIQEDLTPRTLVIRLKNNSVDNISKEITTEPTTTTEKSKDTTTNTTRQTNGHYRNVNQNSRGYSKWLDPNSEANRKRRLELYAKGFRRPSSYNSTYVEIKRNNTQISTTESS